MIERSLKFWIDKKHLVDVRLNNEFLTIKKYVEKKDSFGNDVLEQMYELNFSMEDDEPYTDEELNGIWGDYTIDTYKDIIKRYDDAENKRRHNIHG